MYGIKVQLLDRRAMRSYARPDGKRKRTGAAYRLMVEGERIEVAGVACGIRLLDGLWEVTELYSGMLVGAHFERAVALKAAERGITRQAERSGSWAAYITGLGLPCVDDLDEVVAK